jgi:hypothetical protein
MLVLQLAWLLLCSLRQAARSGTSLRNSVYLTLTELLRGEKKQSQPSIFEGNSSMENTFRFPFPLKKGVSSEKKSTLLQMIVVVSSALLSSSAIATALKAWLENRKTRLTIHINNEGKTLTYQGHHLNQDAPTIYTLVEKLSQHPHVVIPIDVEISPLRDDGQKEGDAPEIGSHQQKAIHDGSEQTVARELPSLLKQLWPSWLSR